MDNNLIKNLSKERIKIPRDFRQKTNYLYNKIKKDKFELEFYIFNSILFYLILLLLPKQIILSNNNYIQQVLSDYYRSTLPTESYVNGEQRSLNDKKILIESTPSVVKLKWNVNLTNFSYMFSNLKNITEVKIVNLIVNKTDFSYTFSNCINLKKFTLDVKHDKEFAIKDMKGL